MKNSNIAFKGRNEIPAGYYKNNKKIRHITISDSVSEIGEEAFSGCTNLNEVVLPKNLKKIPKKAFENCTSLEKVEIPLGVTEIEEDAFLGCHNLEKIELPESVKIIGESAFEGCLDRKLDELVIPGSVETIGNDAFANCSGLEKVIIKNGTLKIGDRCFENCQDLREIQLPDTLLKISNGMFKSCINLKEVKFPKNLTFIEKDAFQGCTDLKEVEIPDSVYEIQDGAFSNCIALKSVKLPANMKKIQNSTFNFCIGLRSIEIPENITEIGEFAFSNCFFLRDVKLPSKLKVIGESAFKNAYIEDITIPDSVEEIGMHAFRNCKSLQSITLPKNLKEIVSHTFSECTHLSRIDIPEGVKTIKTQAFVGCNLLEEVTLPSTIEEIEDDAFLDCDSLQTINVPSSIKNIGQINSNVPFHFTKNKDGFTLSMNPLKDSIPTSILNIDLAFLSRSWKNKDILLKEQRNPVLVNFYNNFIKNLPEKDANHFIENHNFTFLKQLNLDPSKDYNNLFKLLFNLGALSTPIEINGKKVDYSQKVIGLIQEKIKNGDTTIDELNSFDLSKMKSNGFNEEFTEFFLENFSEFIQEQRSNDEFITRAYNEFKDIQRTSTSNHDSQKQLKPTIKKFVDYLDNNKFTGITPETKNIADTISPYFSEQELFDEAVKIFNEKKQRNTPDNILNVRLKENDIFKQIDTYAKNIQESEKDTLSILTELAKKEFTYDWLEKNDPENLILGKLCSCCSHIDGSGYGIMKASIVDPDVQTLVIRNKNGDIIAKSTLFINREERYGVFNNVEVRDDISKEDREKIYNKYMLGIKEFAKQYNIENPDKPLRQINVGMHFNKLYSNIYTNCSESQKILPSIDYGDVYGKEKQNYNGDSSTTQFVLWENDEPQPQ